MTVRALMIEDDVDISRLLKGYLADFNIELLSYASPIPALESISINHYDIVILDLSLPQMDGLDVCRQIVSRYKLPVIISTARGSISDKVTGLELGADDYLPKPYDPRELVARIHSVLRRNGRNLTESSKSEFEVDEERGEISKNGEVLQLTMAEFEMLRLFILKRGFVITREYIANNVEALKWESSERSIDVIVGRIRQKIGDDPKAQKYIKTIRGSGYKMV